MSSLLCILEHKLILYHCMGVNRLQLHDLHRVGAFSSRLAQLFLSSFSNLLQTHSLVPCLATVSYPGMGLMARMALHCMVPGIAKSPVLYLNLY